MERVLLISARRYGFQDDQGRRVDGVQLVYLTDEQDQTADERGYRPLTVSAPLDVFTQVREVPGVYGVEFRQRAGVRGRPTLQVTGLKFERSAELWPVAS